MIILIMIGAVLFIISGILCGISLFGDIYHKISKRTSKTLSNIAFIIVCISGILSWTYILMALFK